MIVLLNPTNDPPKLALFEGQSANLRFQVQDATELSAINVYIDDKLFKILGANVSGQEYAVSVGDTLSPGAHTLEIRATNVLRSRSTRIIMLDILAK